MGSFVRNLLCAGREQLLECFDIIDRGLDVTDQCAKVKQALIERSFYEGVFYDSVACGTFRERFEDFKRHTCGNLVTVALLLILHHAPNIRTSTFIRRIANDNVKESENHFRFQYPGDELRAVCPVKHSAWAIVFITTWKRPRFKLANCNVIRMRLKTTGNTEAGGMEKVVCVGGLPLWQQHTTSSLGTRRHYPRKRSLFGRTEHHRCGAL